MMETDGLCLIPCELAHARAVLRGKDELAEILRVAVPDGWPHFPEAFARDRERLESDASQIGWGTYFFVRPEEGALVGSGGFKDPPDDFGVVEIGYEIAPKYRNRGFATGAARSMIGHAFSHEEVESVTAHTLAQANASNAVLRKAGMSFAGEVGDPSHGKVWRWRISKDKHRSVQ